MKIDINQLTQDKKKLGIVFGLLALVCVGGLAVVLLGGGGQEPSAITPGAGTRGPAATGNDAGDPANNTGTPAAPEGNPAPAGETAPKPVAPKPTAVAASDPTGGDPTAGDGTTILQGPPVEPFRADPFAPAPVLRAPEPRPVLPPVVAVLEPPAPLEIPNAENVIPQGAGGGRGGGIITTEPPRRLSGVLWNGKVVAIVESPSDPSTRRGYIVRPGDTIPGQDVRVQSISRDRMVLVHDDPALAGQEIVVDLKASNRPAGLAPGAPGMLGMPGQTSE